MTGEATICGDHEDSTGRLTACKSPATHTCDDEYGPWFYCDEHSSSCCAPIKPRKEET